MIVIDCRLLGGWPNTYTYTKAVAEEIVKKEAGNMPVGIFRPAVGKFLNFSIYTNLML